MIPSEYSGVFQPVPAGGVTSPHDFVAGAARGGIKEQGDDVLLLVSETERPAAVAAVFTRNAMQAAPVLVCAEHAASGRARAIVANSGCANCCTGERGLAAARRLCELAAARAGIRPEEVLVCSTGLIGSQLPLERIEAALDEVALRRDAETNEAVARAFMTTDTRPKSFALETEIDGHAITVGGQIKGAGMIGPDMGAASGSTPAGSTPHATMLAFLTTDALLEPAELQSALEKAVEKSFNSMTIDGDTSTNDTCLLLANGASTLQITPAQRGRFQALLEDVCVHLAKLAIADGEGATKLVTVRVEGAAREQDAHRIAMTIANSPLVKTAIFGADPNWGRVAAAAGRAGVRFDPAQLQIYLGPVQVFDRGEPAEYSLPTAEVVMRADELTVRVVLGEGDAAWTAWTCDFSYDYVKINAEYHT
jgi:glutamate N-acetyltransferase/amino-acid N-acetyltransferase